MSEERRKLIKIHSKEDMERTRVILNKNEKEEICKE